MLTRDLQKDKIIIVAEQQEVVATEIVAALAGRGFSNVRRALDGDQIYQILKSFSEQPEQVGLIIIDETLPKCQPAVMGQSLSRRADSLAIPLIMICRCGYDHTAEGDAHCRTLSDDWLALGIVPPVNTKELLMSVGCLLRLRQERLASSAENELLARQLSERNIVDARLKYLVAHDELTGLLNRSNFERQLKLGLHRNQKLHRDAALLFIEVDRFNMLNEWKGFDVGDRLLVELTILMRTLEPKNGLFARVGISEFCMFLQGMSKTQVLKYAEQLKAKADAFRFDADGIRHKVTISIGIVMLDELGSIEHPGEMLFHALQACRAGQQAGHGKIGTYTSQDIASSERQHDVYWAPAIAKALRDNQFFLEFQPVVELEDGTISHYEILLRMHCEDKVVQPSVFIPAAERMGLIEAIDLWVVEKAIDFLVTLPAHRSDVSIAIKLSTGAFQYPELIQIIREKLELAWVEARRLIFEITDTAVLEHRAGALSLVNSLRALGCRTLLRNSGEGLYVLEKLKTFPVDYIKIDGQFVKHWISEESDRAILKSIVEMISKLGKKAIFVYVESTDTVLKLRECGASLAQGYTLGRPESGVLEGSSIPFSQYISERHRAEKALQEKESYLRVLIDNIPFLVWLKDTESRFLTVNGKLAQEMGLGSPEAIVGKTDFDFSPPEKARRYQADDNEVLLLQHKKMTEERWVDENGASRWSEIFVAPVLDKEGERLGTLGLARDITDRKNREAELRIAATAFEAQEGIVVTDADAVILKINHSFTRITGYQPEDAIGRKMKLLKSDLQDDAFYANMWAQINRTGNWQGEIWNRRKDGVIYPEWLSITAVKNDAGEVTHYVGTMIDITARKAIEEQMRHIAHHDVLTDLPNRILLADRVQSALAQSRRDNTKLALMYVDLDKFKPVNDNFGHGIGDALLKEVAARLLRCMKRETDTVSRLGGDEFVLLLTNYAKESDVAAVADNILTALLAPFSIERHEINISSSIGIATYPAHGSDVGELMKNADYAMYQAKQAGRSCFKFYDGQGGLER